MQLACLEWGEVSKTNWRGLSGCCRRMDWSILELPSAMLLSCLVHSLADALMFDAPFY